jgi:DNA modification methylase
VFDPVLCEMVYRWFSRPGGRVLDPFAGGSVRGVVAATLGRWYTGIELRPEQVAANRQQAVDLLDPAGTGPVWVEGDARDIDTLLDHPADEFDLLFSCPPYAYLEVYSDDPRDLSTMDYPEFLDAYRAIIAASVARLAPDSFAVVVVGDVRDRRTGNYLNFVGDTTAAFRDAGTHLYNEAILLNTASTAAMRSRQFTATRKLVKVHQNVLVFVKGDAKRATERCGAIDLDGTGGDMGAA